MSDILRNIIHFKNVNIRHFKKSNKFEGFKKISKNAKQKYGFRELFRYGQRRRFLLIWIWFGRLWRDVKKINKKTVQNFIKCQKF